MYVHFKSTSSHKLSSSIIVRNFPYALIAAIVFFLPKIEAALFCFLEVVHQLFNKRKAQHDLINGKMKEKRKLKNNTLVEQNCSRVVVAGCSTRLKKMPSHEIEDSIKFGSFLWLLGKKL